MARYIENLDADGRTGLITVVSPRSGGDSTRMSIFVQGTFGGGTAALEVSADDGTTWIPVVDDTGAAITFTANAQRNLCLVCVAENEGPPIKISIDLTGSTSPDLNFIVYNVR